MSFQLGALRKVHHEAGDRWMLRYRMTRADGKRLECREFVGLVRDFPTKKAARREIERSGLLARINAQEADARIDFHPWRCTILNTIAGRTPLRPKTERTVLNTSHTVHAYLIPQWGKAIADDIKPPDTQRWLKTLETEKGLGQVPVERLGPRQPPAEREPFGRGIPPPLSAPSAAAWVYAHP